MTLVWRLLKYIPPGMLVLVKRFTGARCRMWVREVFGGTYRSIPDRIVRITDGRKFHIGPDCIYWPLHIGLDFEPEATAMVRRLVRPGDTVVDAGANYGWYTTLLAELVGNSGHVHAFEPVPTTYTRLTEHVEINHLEKRVSAIHAAIGKEPGEMEIHLFAGLSHSRASLSTLGFTTSNTFLTPVIPLDRYLDTRGVQKVDFLKCDVEGSELMVLQGAQSLLDKPEAPMILIELNHETCEAFSYKTTDLWRYLQKHGYDHFYEIDAMNHLRRVFTEAEIEKINLLLCGKGLRIETQMASGRTFPQAAA